MYNLKIFKLQLALFLCYYQLLEYHIGTYKINSYFTNIHNIKYKNILSY